MSIFRPLLPESVVVGEMVPRNADPALLALEESALIASAVERRRREFTAGRLLAHRLLDSFGCHGPLLPQPDGPLSWPSGIVGSITHCRTLAAAAIARDLDCAGIGIDVEADKPLPDGVSALVLTDEERRWMGRTGAQCDALAVRVFCAKEALYKAIYPVARRFLQFHDVVIEQPSAHGNLFLARLCVEAPPFTRGSIMQGRWQAEGGHVAAAMVLPAGRENSSRPLRKDCSARKRLPG